MPRSESGTVIMVEDDPSVCQALDRILRLGGFVPRMYGSAEAYLDDDRKHDAVCMVLDVQLPGMSGLALRDLISAKGAIPPVIFVTAFDEPEVRAHAARVGATFLAKPFSGRLLLETIRSVARASGPGADVRASDA